MSSHRLTPRTTLAGLGVGQTNRNMVSMHEVANCWFNRVGRCRLSGWGPRDNFDKWLKTVDGMDQNQSQYRR